MKYFSERERGERPRTVEEIDDTVREGIFALISSRIRDGSFAASYPERYRNEGIEGMDYGNFYRAMRADIPDLPEDMTWEYPDELEAVDIFSILDILEFCWRNIGNPKRYRLPVEEEEDAGQREFSKGANRIFRRNGLVYTLTDIGVIERILPPILSDKLSSEQFHTGDVELDRMLDLATHKILDPKPAVRRESLKEMWDAWERIKTLDGMEKKKGVKRLLNNAAGANNLGFRQSLEREAKELTDMGNAFQIRHSEMKQEKLESTEHIDYLFHRMFSMIELILRTR